MSLSPYGRREWLTILVVGLAVAAGAVLLHLPWLIVPDLLAVGALLSFFRDPVRVVPYGPGIMVSPADGQVSSVHTIENYPPFGEPAVCVRIFLSVLNVHVNRSPCAGEVASLTHLPGKYMNALNPKSADVNESNLILLVDPVTKKPVAAVRQVSGAIARTIVCGVKVGEVVTRGQHIGMIKFGSTTELLIPASAKPVVQVKVGEMVKGAGTVLVKVDSN